MEPKPISLLYKTILFLILCCSAASAQENPLGQPLLDGNGYIREEAFIHIPLQPEDQVYADIDGRWMKAVLQELIQFSQDDKQSGRLFWGRNLGTEAHELSQQWAEQYFVELGLQDPVRAIYWGGRPGFGPVRNALQYAIRVMNLGSEFRIFAVKPVVSGMTNDE